MSAAYAAVLTMAAATAAMKDFTLTICFILFSTRPRTRGRASLNGAKGVRKSLNAS
jgi:hypothetical protein